MDIVFFGVLEDMPMVVIWLIAAVVLVVICLLYTSADLGVPSDRNFRRNYFPDR